MKVVTFKVEEELLERLDSYARLKGVTRSEIIRKAIELYLRLEEKKIVPQPKVVKLTS
ncbi:MAG TPA: ribbon-helix-helix protein, CopG family [Pyrodictium sp.]|nr:ribbon-helix-helix protein, CopG family [Pyrodictium sp.]HIQ56031.1 ribbon-helix-helix protein, CopG family [Pyrodictium sp.]